MTQNNIVPIPSRKHYIQAILDEYCVSQRQFAKNAGMDRPYLNRIILGKKSPGLYSIQLISRGLEKLDGQDWKLHAKILRGIYGL